MLVRLLDLPDMKEKEASLRKEESILIRRPISPEMSQLIEWTEEHFSEFWANEVQAAFFQQPPSCFIAQKGNEIIGFACYETTARSFFGPTGVLPEYRKLGLGKVLLVKSLEALREMGYVYGIIGGVGPEEYYKKTVNAVTIDGSEKNIYENLLRRNDRNEKGNEKG